jgi:hypothetical protein
LAASSVVIEGVLGAPTLSDNKITLPGGEPEIVPIRTGLSESDITDVQCGSTSVKPESVPAETSRTIDCLITEEYAFFEDTSVCGESMIVIENVTLF